MNLAYSILVSLVWFLSTYFMIVFLLILLTNRKKLYDSRVLRGNAGLPMVSMIVPAYNEEASICNSIASLRKVDYPKDRLEIIIVNDGSKDKTGKRVRSCLQKGDNLIFLDNKVNKGKAACLNQGILASHGKYVATMDADSEVDQDILRKTIPYFDDPKVGAVTVSVEVKDPTTFLERLIDLEYIIGLSLSLKSLSFINAIHVTPGPFSIYSRKVLDRIGLFDPHNITEDLEIAYRLQKHRYRIENCTAAKVRTVIPGTLKRLYIQRKRWYSGALLTLMKHRDLVFNNSIGPFSVVMPFTFLLTSLGLFLFGYSTFLMVKNIVKAISFYSLTNFNFFSHMFPLELDILTVSTLTFFGVLSVMFAFGSAIICLRVSKNSIMEKIQGIAGFFLLFFLYQFFWASSFFSVLFRRQVKWR